MDRVSGRVTDRVRDRVSGSVTDRVRVRIWIWIWIVVGRAPNWDITPTRCVPTERLG